MSKPFMARALTLILATCLVGCTAPRGPLVVTDPDPGIKIPAIKKAVRRQDMTAVRQMVTDLNNDDPAVRFYAIEGLERLTGQTLDYRYWDDEDQRKPALARWQQWLSEQDQHFSSGAGE